MASPKTILISGQGHRKEGVTDEAVTPGHLLELGGGNDLQKHATAAGNAAPMFALENDLVGDGIDNAYAAGETVQYVIAQPGAVIYALLAYGENVAIGAMLESASAGALQASVADSSDVQTEAIVARALEAVNNTTTDSEARIKVEVL